MIISEKRYYSSKEYYCEMCHSKILKDKKYFRLFGMANKGEKPYEIMECIDCNHTRHYPQEPTNE